MSELDDLFKEAAQSEQATFKPEYWEQYANQYINQNQDQNTSLGLFWTEIGLLGVFLISILYFGLITNDSQTYSNEMIARKELATKATSPVSFEKNETKTASSENAGVESLRTKKVEKRNSESADSNNLKRTVGAISGLSSGNKERVKRATNDLFANNQNGQVNYKTDYAAGNNSAVVLVPAIEKREEVTQGIERTQKETLAEATQPDYLVVTVADSSSGRPSKLVDEKEESNQEVNSESVTENSQNTEMNIVPDSAEQPQKKVSEVTRSRIKKLQFAA